MGNCLFLTLNEQFCALITAESRKSILHIDILSSPVLFRSNFYSDNSADNSLLTVAPIVCEGFVWSWFCDVVLWPNIKISVFRGNGSENFR